MTGAIVTGKTSSIAGRRPPLVLLNALKALAGIDEADPSDLPPPIIESASGR